MSYENNINLGKILLSSREIFHFITGELSHFDTASTKYLLKEKHLVSIKKNVLFLLSLVDTLEHNVTVT